MWMSARVHRACSVAVACSGPTIASTSHRPSSLRRDCRLTLVNRSRTRWRPVTSASVSRVRSVRTARPTSTSAIVVRARTVSVSTVSVTTRAIATRASRVRTVRRTLTSVSSTGRAYMVRVWMGATITSAIAMDCGVARTARCS
uniref:Putative secreted protein n=1 Tax=Anopheles darlingi TaxID=43151 RepID=A0A2M4D1P9_ANODA